MAERRVYILAVVCVLVCTLMAVLQITAETNTVAPHGLAGESATSTADRVIPQDRPVSVPSAVVMGISDPGIIGYDD